MKTYFCEDENKLTKSECINKYEENLYIDVQPKSSKKLKRFTCCGKFKFV